MGPRTETGFEFMKNVAANAGEWCPVRSLTLTATKTWRAVSRGIGAIVRSVFYSFFAASDGNVPASTVTILEGSTNCLIALLASWRVMAWIRRGNSSTHSGP